MIFSELTAVFDKLRLLQYIEILYYLPTEEIITSADNTVFVDFFDSEDDFYTNAVEMEVRDVKTLKSFYQQVYHTNTTMTCADCRDHRLIQIDIEFSRFLNEMKEKYGG